MKPYGLVQSDDTRTTKSHLNDEHKVAGEMRTVVARDALATADRDCNSTKQKERRRRRLGHSYDDELAADFSTGEGG